MIYEREVLSTGIVDALESLDFDEGMRVQDSSGRIAFITRSSGEFCINILKESGDEWFYADRSSQAYDLLRKHMREPFKAWLY